MTDTAKAEIHKREFKNIRGDSFTQWTITMPGASARVDNRIVGALLDEYDALRAVEAAARTVAAHGRHFTHCASEQLPAVLEPTPCNCEAADIVAAIAALDAIRTPDDGKRGGARL